jgi:hypothetical protein
VNKGKTKFIKNNSTGNTSFTLKWEDLEEIKSFAYLESTEEEIVL